MYDCCPHFTFWKLYKDGLLNNELCTYLLGIIVHFHNYILKNVRHTVLLPLLGLYSLSSKTSYRQISWSLKPARLDVIMILPFWHFTGISAAVLPRCRSNFKTIWKVLIGILQLRNFKKSCGKTYIRLVNRGLGMWLLIDGLFKQNRFTCDSGKINT